MGALGIVRPSDLESVRAAEGEFRALWSYTRAIAEMFEGYPRYAPAAYAAPVVTETTTELSEMPAIAGPQDMRAMITRLRPVQEDPRQLRSGCIADYAAVPGFDGVAYQTGI